MRKDIIELLRNAETSVVLDDGKMDLVNHVAADEIERLREALREMMDLSHRRTTHPMSDEADYYRIARAALGEDK